MFLPLLLAGASAPSDGEVLKAAARCGIRPSQIVWSTDAQGARHADIMPGDDLDSMPFSAVECIMRWNAAHKVRIGFVAQPPDTTPAPR